MANNKNLLSSKREDPPLQLSLASLMEKYSMKQPKIKTPNKLIFCRFHGYHKSKNFAIAKYVKQGNCATEERLREGEKGLKIHP